jgi:hypothetical protein
MPTGDAEWDPSPSEKLGRKLCKARQKIVQSGEIESLHVNNTMRMQIHAQKAYWKSLENFAELARTLCKACN